MKPIATPEDGSLARNDTVKQSQDLLVRTRDRQKDAPMPTEWLLEDASEEISRLREAEKLTTHLQETNDVLLERVRQLEMKLEKAEKALAVEREACAKVAEDFSAGMTDWWSGLKDDGSKVQSDASIGAAKVIAHLIRARGEK